MADRDRWEVLTSTSLATTQAAAEKWRTGLAAFVTLVTGGLLVKGPESANDLTTPWRLALTLLAASGLAAAIGGLWLALRAAAGAPGKVNYREVVQQYVGVRQFEVAAAQRASEALRWAKVTVALSLVLLAAAVFAWWWAPSKPSSPPARLEISEDGTTKYCGTLVSADKQQFRIHVDGESEIRVIAFADTVNVRVVATC